MISQAILTANNPIKSAATLALLVFKVNDQLYGLPVTSIVRIIEMVTLTPLPGVSEIIEGIINLHGKTVPVMALRRRFNLPPRAYGLHTPIILVDLINNNVLGLIVDRVEDVLEVSAEDLELTETIVPPELTAQLATGQAAYLSGIAKVDRHLILVLDVHALLSPTVQNQLTQVLKSRNE